VPQIGRSGIGMTYLQGWQGGAVCFSISFYSLSLFFITIVYDGSYASQMPSDGPGLGWTVNVSWAWMGSAASEVLCDPPTSMIDYWGNPYAGTVVIADFGKCPNGIKAQNAMLLGAAGIAILTENDGDPEVMLGSQHVTIPVQSVTLTHSLFLAFLPSMRCITPNRCFKSIHQRGVP
jgi:hypothetical protein